MDIQVGDSDSDEPLVFKLLILNFYFVITGLSQDIRPCCRN